ncbi:FAD/FMN-containing dehydrogenase [Rhizobium sp. BK529]|uniref:FAD-binding oxidoreductase n=1 Tax=unclassified Rhizobium TaxID=2613769 RepID=UPI00104636DE|nr:MULTISPECIES: FAD-binding oxidoreductase [unclassified Rhizobium]MBB3595058.1 FAD/FMN-containing dehydrogenase [Rhizobium sp. BK529]TCR98683.1 FAD/FMN-containing dehydrogenase [Rhizobium sp. BK418]
MDLLGRLRSVLPHDTVLTGNDMAGHLQDWWGRQQGSALCVALPRSREDVAAIVSICAASGHGIVPQGGNTGLTGAGVPVRHDNPPIIVSLSRMRQIRNIDPANGTMSVDAGCILADVRTQALAVGRLFPVSLGAEGSCQIGGIISTNAGGTNVLRYGSTRENVLGLEVVLPDGTIWNGMKGLRKDNAGYDLRHLFIGAEGSLGIVTGAVLKLHPLPRAHATVWLSIADPARALALLNRLQTACGERLTTFELMNAAQLAGVIACQPALRLPTEGPWHLLVELADLSQGEALETMLFETIGAALDAGEITEAFPAQNSAQRAKFWALRHGTAEANRRSGHVLSSDVSVPISAVPDFLASASSAVRASFPQADIVVVSHMGDGNVHFGTRFAAGDWQALTDQTGTVLAVRRIVNDCAQAHGGSFSAEHGIGRKLTAELIERTDPAALLLMRRLKAAIDPHGIMNPGCLLD